MPPRIRSLSPPLKWAGGKRWLLPRLRRFYSSCEESRLIEPFCGGLSVALGLDPGTALLNDANAHLINFFRQVRQGLAIDLELVNDRDVYYRHRQRFNELILTHRAATREGASLFYYLNRTGFNGLCRFNRAGLFNVPFGSYKTINYRTDFREFEDRFRNWNFSSGDFSKLALTDSDFIYADPPYDVEFTTYSPGGFRWEDQVRLVEWLAKHPGPVVLSNQKTPRIYELYQDAGYHVTCLDAPRRISCTGDRRPAREVLAVRNLRTRPEHHDGQGL